MEETQRRGGAIGTELDYIRERARADRLERALAALARREREIHKHGQPSPTPLRHSIRDFSRRLHATRARISALERRLPPAADLPAARSAAR